MVHTILRYVVGGITGLLSGILVYFMVTLAFTDPSVEPPDWHIWVFFMLPWFVSFYVFAKNTKSISKVMVRSFLVGALEWLLMIPAGLIFSAKTASDVAAGSTNTAETAGIAIGAGIVSFLTGGIAFVMLVGCLIGYFISNKINVEMKKESA